MAKKKKMGIVAVFGAPKRYLHLREDVDAKYPNATQHYLLEGLLVAYQGVIEGNHKDQVCIFFNTMTSLTNVFIVSNDMQML